VGVSGTPIDPLFHPAIPLQGIEMLTKQTPETIKARLTVKAQGVETDLLLTYINHKPEEFDAFVKNPDVLKIPDDVNKSDTRLALAHVNATFVLFLVKSFDDGTDTTFPLTRAGLIDLESHWPETLPGIVAGYHQARGAAVQKN
jgi:hypothetical protein